MLASGKLHNFFIFLILILSLFPLCGSCNEDGELDQSVGHCPGLCIYDDEEASKAASKEGAYTVAKLYTELMEEEEWLGEIKKWNLRGNHITTKGAKVIAKLAENMTSLEELNLSRNQMDENAIVEFTSLLLRKNFKFLNVSFNKGAGSIDAVKILMSKLDLMVPHDNEEQCEAKLVSYLTKVIWIPPSHLSMSNMLGGVPQKCINAHKKYYKTH